MEGTNKGLNPIFSPSSVFGQYQSEVLQSGTQGTPQPQSSPFTSLTQDRISVQRQQVIDAQTNLATSQQVPANILPSHSGQRIQYTHSVVNGNITADLQQQIYYRKWKRLKKIIKNLIFLNASVCDETVRIEEKIHKAKEERRFLLRKLMQYQTATDNAVVVAKHQAVAISNNVKLSPSTPTSQVSSLLSDSGKSKPRKKPPATPSTSDKKKSAKELLDSIQQQVKPKKMKSHSGKRLVPPIPLDSAGRPMLPLNLGELTIHSLGEIVSERPGFHSIDCIFPVGYCSTRLFSSLINVVEKCLYTCKISDGGSGPIFEISPEDNSGQIFRSIISPTDCHSQLLKAINLSRGLEILDTKGNGPEFFGLTHPVIQNLIQSCPGAKKCTHYKWIKYEISKTDTVESYAVSSTVDSFVNYSALTENLDQGQSPSKGPVADLSSLRSLLTGGKVKQMTGPS